MAQIDYGVVFQGGRWRLVGQHMRFGAFRSQAEAERAARQFAQHCAGLPVNLHIQTPTGELLPPRRIEPPG